MQIDYPSQKETEQAIKAICEKGVRPQKLPHFLWEMTSSFGFTNAFRKVTDALLLSVVLYAAALALLGVAVLSPEFEKRLLSPLIFAFSPLLYLLFAFFCGLKERESGVFDLKMTCRYTVHHLLAYRMFVFALVSLSVDSVLLMFVTSRSELPFFSTFCLSSLALLIFSLSLMWALLHLRSGKAIGLVTLLWCVLNVAAVPWAGKILWFFGAFPAVLPVLVVAAVFADGKLLSRLAFYSSQNTKGESLC